MSRLLRNQLFCALSEGWGRYALPWLKGSAFANTVFSGESLPATPQRTLATGG